MASDTPRARVDWEEMDRLEAFGTFGGRIVPYNGRWKIMLNETNCELWSLKTREEAEAKLADAIKKSGYSDDENPLAELARLKANQQNGPNEMPVYHLLHSVREKWGAMCARYERAKSNWHNEMPGDWPVEVVMTMDELRKLAAIRSATHEMPK